jgi:acetyl esterase/lipase
MVFRYFVSLLLSLVPQTPAQTSPLRIPDTVTAVRDVKYGKGNGHPLLLDLYMPRNRKPGAAPAVIWIHGIDPDHIGVAGGSAGGHLALLIGTSDVSAGLEGTGGWEGVSSRVQAANAEHNFRPVDHAKIDPTQPEIIARSVAFFEKVLARIQ